MSNPLPAFDLDRARRETPGCTNVLHFNNAGAALMPQPVLDAVINHLQLEASTGGYEAASQAKAEIEHVYDAVAALINCERDEVAIVENATRAWDMAFYAIPFQPGDRILTAQAEYASNYIAFLQVAKRTGAVIEVIPDDDHGQISLSALRAAIDERVKLIAITHTPTNGGLVNPAAAVGRIAKAAGVLYLLDACQSVGQIPIDVQALGCDMLSATSRKFLRGPRGQGFLYVRRDVMGQLEPPLLDFHAADWVAQDAYRVRPDARRFENWETNIAAKIGLGVAIDYALGWDMAVIAKRISDLARQLRAQLNALPGVTTHDRGIQQCGIVSFSVEGQEPERIQQQLREKKINVSVSGLGSTRLDMAARGIEKLVRASVHYYNSEAEIERFIDALKTLRQ